jgi:hypothetical protein
MIERGYKLLDGAGVAYVAISGGVQLDVKTDLGHEEAAIELLRHASLIGRVGELGSTIIVSDGDFADADTVFFNTRFLAFVEDLPEISFSPEVPE